MHDLRTELRGAMEARGYTYDRLLQESGLDIDVSSLNRKLNGAQSLSGDEGLALAKALGVRAATVDRVLRLAETIGVNVAWPAIPRGRAA